MGVTTPEEFEEVFRAAYESGDAARVASLYEDDAVLIQPGIDHPIVGREAIEQAMVDTFGFLSGITLQFREPAVFRVEGDLAWVHGICTTEFSLPDGSRHSADAPSTTILHRGDDGRWRLVFDRAA